MKRFMIGFVFVVLTPISMLLIRLFTQERIWIVVPLGLLAIGAFFQGWAFVRAWKEGKKIDKQFCERIRRVIRADVPELFD